MNLDTIRYINEINKQFVYTNNTNIDVNSNTGSGLKINGCNFLHIIIVKIITLNEKISLTMITDTGCKPEESQKIQMHNVVIGSQLAVFIPFDFTTNQDASAHILRPEMMAVT